MPEWILVDEGTFPREFHFPVKDLEVVHPARRRCGHDEPE